MEAKKDKLFRTKQLVMHRSQALARDLQRVLAQVQMHSSKPNHWTAGELRDCQARLHELEELETVNWVSIAELEGRPAQKRRMERWKEWRERQSTRIQEIKTIVWTSQSATSTGPSTGHSGPCHRTSGHVEKVRLPQFSGKQEEFAEFRGQFRELCRGEGYTAILEMAQLKTKLPREALTAIAGLQDPDVAWTRLEELYGNRELSVLSALKRIREFKSSKALAYEQVIDLASAVQRCCTELNNIGALKELLNDREALACIIQALPQASQDKWYDKEIPEETSKRGEVLLEWLERQRKNAIRIRLDAMAAKIRTPTVSGTKATTAGESTEKGLVSSSLHTQASSRAADKESGDAAADAKPDGETQKCQD